MEEGDCSKGGGCTGKKEKQFFLKKYKILKNLPSFTFLLIFV